MTTLFLDYSHCDWSKDDYDKEDSEYEDLDGDPPVGFTNLVPLGGNPNTITVSGFSSGSTMSDQLAVIMSSTFKGAGLICGGPWDSINVWKTSEDRTGAQIATEVSIPAADQAQTDGVIDDIANLNGKPIYIMQGMLDDFVLPKF